MKTKAHIRYKNKAGKIVPGVTTILGLLAKPQLIPWANKLGLQGIDSTAYRDEAGIVGTLAHYLIFCYHKGIEPDYSDYTPKQIARAQNSFYKYCEWVKPYKLEPILLEEPLVSEEYQYGGTIDNDCLLNNVPFLLDYKTGSIYPEHYYQICAYRQLLIENGYDRPNEAIILGIPREINEPLNSQLHLNFEKGWEIFLHLREIYKLREDR